MIRQIIGQLDGTLIANQEFHEHITTLQIDHDYQEIPDVAHAPMRLLHALGHTNWAFYNSALNKRAVVCEDIDLTADNRIGILDLVIMADHWLNESFDLAGDVDKNGMVDYDDLRLFSSFWLCNCRECLHAVTISETNFR